MARYLRKALIRRVSSKLPYLFGLVLILPDHLFFFNLRAFDRLNMTPAMVKQEEKSGVKYQDVQRAHAQEIMGEGLRTERERRHRHLHRGRRDSSSSSSSSSDDDDEAEIERIIDQRRRFEAMKDQSIGEDPVESTDSIAEDAMQGGGKVSEEPWEGDPEEEKQHFVQEELYIHAKVDIVMRFCVGRILLTFFKVLIVDDRIAVCGSSNLNDRVSSRSQAFTRSSLTRQ